MWKIFNPPKPYDAIPEPEKPAYGSIRISPLGTESFVVHRYEMSDSAMRRPSSSAWWTSKLVGTKEECEAWAKKVLMDELTEKEDLVRQNEAIQKHHAENPVRIVTLEDFK